ncbi:hypothetical protein PENVUL_c084G07890 [Penicillium vulpinum]|uniref:Uncharacterized protein n=2 Tax=Penicillium vulpinum TaxID=29845 RepID=A0A1V6R713_9EURO|nr:hypothetical protein PENVUL_c084G07890 [Penicillium vulpinum]
MPELDKDKNKETPSSPLPKDLQDLVDKDEEDREIRADYENSWTTTRSEDNDSTESVNTSENTKDQLLDRGAEKKKQ